MFDNALGGGRGFRHRQILSPANQSHWFSDIKIDYSPIYVILASLAINVLSLALPIASLQVYDRIIAKNGISTLNMLALGVVVALAMESLLQIARSYVSGWVGAAIEHRIYNKAVKHILSGGCSKKNAANLGTQLQKLTAIGKLREFYSGQALASMIDLPFAMVFLGLIYYLAGSLVLVPITILFFFGLRAYVCGRYTQQALKERDQADDQKYDFLIDVLGGIHTTKSLGLEAGFVRQYEALQSNSSRCNYNLTKLSAEAVNDAQVYGQIMVACIVIFGAPMVVAKYFSMGSLIACILLAGRILQPIQRSFGLWLRYQDFKSAQEKLDDFFKNAAEEPAYRQSYPQNEGHLELNGIAYIDPDSSSNNLRHVSLQLFPGQCIAISGKNEESKTSLLRIMAGLLVPSAGQAKLNGLDVRDYPHDERIRHCAYLPMRGVIFQGTIYDNLSHFGRIDPETVREISELLGIDTEIAKLPNGMETVLEDIVADPIPPGLKQRIAIARSIAHKPKLILFNNADRDLDKDGYNLLYRLMGRLKGKATLVLVTEDQNILSLAEQKFVLNENGISAEPETPKQAKANNFAIMEMV